MPGVRLHHPTLHSCVMTVEHTRPYKEPFLCPTCQKTHLNKTYHLYLDSSGDVIVSETVLERLQQIGMAGFTIENQVSNPPKITLGLQGQQESFVIKEHKLGDPIE